MVINLQWQTLTLILRRRLTSRSEKKNTSVPSIFQQLLQKVDAASLGSRESMGIQKTKETTWFYLGTQLVKHVRIPNHATNHPFATR